MLYTEVIYSIRERLQQVIDDSNISDREIIFHVNNQRSLFYRNQYNQRNRAIDADISQKLFVSVSETSDDLCATSDCNILRSTVKIPNAIELHERNAILNVYSTDIGSVPFSLVEWSQFPFVSTSKWTKNDVYVSLSPDGYLYLKSSSKLTKFIEKLIVVMILENPLDVEGFQSCSGGTEDCFDLSTFEYPLKGYALVYISDAVTKLLIGKLQLPEDTKNDSEAVN